MPKFNQGIRTEAGQDLFGRVNSGLTSIHYTKIVYSSLDLSNKSDDEIAQMTDVNPKELIVPNPSVLYKPKTATTDPETEIRAIGSNEILQKGFYINTYALFASDDSGHEILLGVTLDDHPSWLPAYDGVRPQALTYNWDIGDKDTNNVHFTDSHDAYATYADLQQYSSAINYSADQRASNVSSSLTSYSNTFNSITNEVVSNSSMASQNNDDIKDLYSNQNSDSSTLNSLSKNINSTSINISPITRLHVPSDWPTAEICNLSLKADTTYYISAVVHSDSNGKYGIGPVVNDTDVTSNTLDNWVSNGQTFFASFKANINKNVPIIVHRTDAGTLDFSQICIQSDKYLPYSIAQRNRINNLSGDFLGSPNLVTKTSCTGNGFTEICSVPIIQGNSYYISGNITNGGNVGDPNNIGLPSGDHNILLSGDISVNSFIAPFTGNLDLQLRPASGTTTTTTTELCVTMSNQFVPFSIAQDNRNNILAVLGKL